ncbi:hypothetical protein F2Q69_00028978 [Brassica cretica]|uniref:Uncharacterized protein n=1 Tax=Brassica cretica TaxID=69181 RepID=A0A8S9RT04_BRACR|nr:hypothetical protein F2Q69_00028978 [Brassica cretica]
MKLRGFRDEANLIDPTRHMGFPRFHSLLSWNSLFRCMPFNGRFVADWSSLVSLNKLMSKIGFELHSSGLHQCLVNALDMSKAGIDRRSAAVVVQCCPLVIDRFRRDVVDRCHMF